MNTPIYIWFIYIYIYKYCLIIYNTQSYITTMDLSDASLPPRLASATCPPMAATETSAPRQAPVARAPDWASPRPSGPGRGAVPV